MRQAPDFYAAAVRKWAVEVLIGEVLDKVERGALPTDRLLIRNVAFALYCHFRGKYAEAGRLALDAAHPRDRRSPLLRFEPQETFTIAQLRRGLDICRAMPVLVE